MDPLPVLIGLAATVTAWAFYRWGVKSGARRQRALTSVQLRNRGHDFDLWRIQP